MIGFFNRLFRCGWFPLVFQLMTFAAFIFLIIIGFVADTNDMAYAKILRNTNIANLLVWSYWWPLIIISAIFLGRVWCTVCPMELVTSLASKFGFKLKFPKALKSGWVITGFYILILFIGVHTLSIHRVPYRMALYMLVLFGAAVVFGLLFSRNTFCAHVCPVGYLLGLYARLAPVGWGVKSESTCSGCKDKSCVSTKTAYEFQGRSCGVGLNPAGLDDNTECLVCGQCLKACDGNNPGLKERPNPGLKRRPWFKDIFDLKAMNAAQTFFCLVVSGFIIYEIFVEWKVSKKLLMWAPKELEKLPGFNCALGHGMVKSLTLYVVLPLLIWLVPYGLFRLMGGRLSLGKYMPRFGIAFIPIMAAGHAIKSLLKTTSRLPYWEYIFSEPTGIETARSIQAKTLKLAALPGWRDPLMTFLAFALMLGAILISILVIRKLIAADVPQQGVRCAALYLIPILYGGIYTTMLIAWRFM